MLLLGPLLVAWSQISGVWGHRRLLMPGREEQLQSPSLVGWWPGDGCSLGQCPAYCPWDSSPQVNTAFPRRKRSPGWPRALWALPGRGILAECSVSLAAGRLPSVLGARSQRLWVERRNPREHLASLCCSSPPAPGIPRRAPHNKKPRLLTQARVVSPLAPGGGEDAPFSLLSWNGFIAQSSSHLPAALQSLAPGSLRQQSAPWGPCPLQIMPALLNAFDFKIKMQWPLHSFPGQGVLNFMPENSIYQREPGGLWGCWPVRVQEEGGYSNSARVRKVGPPSQLSRYTYLHIELKCKCILVTFPCCEVTGWPKQVSYLGFLSWWKPMGRGYSGRKGVSWLSITNTVLPEGRQGRDSYLIIPRLLNNLPL